MRIQQVSLVLLLCFNVSIEASIMYARFNPGVHTVIGDWSIKGLFFSHSFDRLAYAYVSSHEPTVIKLRMCVTVNHVPREHVQFGRRSTVA